MPFIFANVFEPHEKPERALPVRCHVLHADHASALENFLVQSLPECYTTKKHLKLRIVETQLPLSELLSNKLPDTGSVMSGDFGEIIAMYFLSSERTEKTTLVKKWKYKQDSKKAAPHSDVVIFHRENSTTPSEHDFIICAEAKQKATSSKKYIPIINAIEGYVEDKTGRLARTLTWLREKAIDQESTKKIKFLDRFTVDPTVEYLKHFKAIAIIDRALLDVEITRKIDLPHQDDSFEVVVLGIDDLKTFYERVYTRAINEVTLE